MRNSYRDGNNSLLRNKDLILCLFMNKNEKF